jgi:hypothetical protein
MNATVSIRLLLLIWLLGHSGTRLSGQTRECWVAPGGSLIQSGTVDQPMDSLATALQKWAGNVCPTNSLRIILRVGVYYLNTPVLLPAGRPLSETSSF